MSISKPLVRAILIPDIDRPIGGVKQLYRHVEHLVRLGWDAAILTENPNYQPSWFITSAPSHSLKEAYSKGELTPHNCIIILPETYLCINFNDFYGYDISQLCRVIFNQNAYYTYSQINSNTFSLINEFYESPLLLQVLSVSEDTHQFLSTNLSLPDKLLSRIVNSIEPLFTSELPKSSQMYWMPRKNEDHVQAVLLGLKRCALEHSQGWNGAPLSGLTHQKVADALNSARLFLSFGHPEGFGLPIAEAMASGCWVIGYSGGGGNELFRLGASNVVPFGDWHSFVSSIQTVFTRFHQQPREMELLLRRQALAVRTLYSIEEEAKSIGIAWDRIHYAFKTIVQQL